MGINAFPAKRILKVMDTKTIKKTSKKVKKVNLAGRLMSRKNSREASFAELQDSDGRIQIYFNRDEICTGEDKTLYNRSLQNIF